VQLRLPWSAPRAERDERTVDVAGHAVPVAIARHRLARRYVVRVGPDGGVRLTIPRGASITGGLAFARRQAGWIARERARLHQLATGFAPGCAVWFRGERVTIAEDGFEERLRAIAARELPARCLELSAAVGIAVARVSVRNQRSRWGACSSRGVITLNWRLVQMPAEVSDYVIFHELMHVRQPNHSRRFWREVESVCAGWRDAERWLRKHGRDIL
jgi:predicted metal-dependent hydrolase